MKLGRCFSKREIVKLITTVAVVIIRKTVCTMLVTIFHTDFGRSWTFPSATLYWSVLKITGTRFSTRETNFRIRNSPTCAYAFLVSVFLSASRASDTMRITSHAVKRVSTQHQTTNGILWLNCYTSLGGRCRSRNWKCEKWALDAIT